MKYTNTAVALAALAFPAVRAQGTAAVVNMCDFPVYLWSVGDTAEPMVALPNQTIGYQEGFHGKPDGSGISLKIAPSYVGEGVLDFEKNVTQFEYTLESSTNQVWYDISYVNGNAFQGTPVLLQPSDLSCPNVTCAADDAVCKEVYNNPHDDTATHVCGADQDLFFLLCPPNDDKSAAASPPTTSNEAVTTTTTSTTAENVVVDANGNVQLQAAPAGQTGQTGQTSNKAVTAPSLNTLTSIGAFDNMVDHWIQGPSGAASAKRDEEQLSVRHSHKHFHERRRNRAFRHSHD